MNDYRKILYISPFCFFPPTTGGERAIGSYLNELSRKNNVVVCAPFQQINLNRKNLVLKKLYNNSKTKYLNIFAYWKIYKLTQDYQFKSLIFAFPYQGYFCYLIAKIANLELVFHEHNIEFLRFKRLGRWWWPLMYIYEVLLYKLVDRVDSISETDRQLAIRYFKARPQKIIYTPYQVDRSIFKPDKTAYIKIRSQLSLKGEPIILFFGTLDYKPNLEAVRIIHQIIAPRIYKKNSRVKFLIVGKNPPKDVVAPNIIFTGLVPRIEDYINASDLVIVPLISGGGIRTKILESLACGKIVISTPLGAEGINEEVLRGQLIINKSVGALYKSLLAVIK